MEVHIGFCLCLLRVSDILAESEPEEAYDLLRKMVVNAEELFNSEAWGYARGLHETICEDAKDVVKGKYAKNQR